MKSPSYSPVPGSRVAVGMSGGIDSSVAAYLLKRLGCDVTGVTMQIWDGSFDFPDTGRSGCFGPGEAAEIESARALAARIGIPHVVVPLADEYRKEVVGYFRSEYLAGRTPNPCCKCNRNIKFGELPEKLRNSGIGFDFFATGHYARTRFEEIPGRAVLLKGRDRAKDQSYFLALLRSSVLNGVCFPLGEMTKAEVRNLASSLGWSEFDSIRESQDFIESDHYSDLFEKNEVRPGPIIDRSGRVLGEHKGLVNYTVGQRKNLGLGGGREKPLYVTSLDGCANAVVVGEYADLFRRKFIARDVNWLSRDGAPAAPLRVTAKIRQQHAGASAILTGLDGGRVEAIFDEPQMAITPGQVAAFYDGELVVGGGIIES